MNLIAPLRQEFNDAFFVGVSRESLLAAAEFLEQVTANSERGLPLLEHAESQAKSSARQRKKR